MIPFSVITKDISTAGLSAEINIFSVGAFNQTVIDFLDNNLVRICLGRLSTIPLDIVKSKLKRLFAGKGDDWEIGAISEFFMHAFLIESNYQQECMYLNLEERSIKKGFDGCYTKDDILWLAESKSGFAQTANISHKAKIKEALGGLEDMLNGGTTNDPWANAYNHACHRDVGTSEKVTYQILAISVDYMSRKFKKLEDFPVIPCATIFMENTALASKIDEIGISTHLVDHNLKKANVICVTNDTVNNFKKYIGM